MAKYQTIIDIRRDESEGLQISKLRGHAEMSSKQAKELLGIDVNSIKFESGWNKTLTHNNILPPAYVVCASTLKSKQIMQRFKCNDYFTIHNVHEFKKALERAISNEFEVQHSLDKHVEYKLDKSKNHSIERLIDSNETLQKIDAMSFFRKTNEYAVESEYRFVYIINAENPPREIFIKLTQEEINASCTFHKIGEEIISTTKKVGRNDLCPCGSNKKYKHCHGKNS